MNKSGPPTRLQDSSRPIPAAADVASANHAVVCPLSPAQEQLWYLHQFLRATAVYSLPLVFRLRGQLDPVSLQRAFDDLVGRNESLRTTFAVRDGSPVQVVHRSVASQVTLIELTTLEPAAREAEAIAMLTSELRQTFDLTEGPLCRALLLRLDDQHHILALFIHHIVSDGWSLGLISRQLSALYRHHALGTPHGLPDDPVQFPDCAAWQREQASTPEFAAALDYWGRTLEGAPSAFSLPADHPRPPVQSFAGATLGADLPPALVASVHQYARATGVSTFVVYLAVFQVFLHRLSGRDDIIVGAPFAGRSEVEFEDVIGYFANMLVLRGSTAGDPTFREFTRQAREVCADAFDHANVPFARIVEHMRPPRNPGQNPVFQIAFSLQGAESENVLDLPGIECTPVDLQHDTATFDLTLTVATRRGTSRLEIEYCTDLFTDETAARILEQFQVLLAAAIAAPDTPLDSLPLLSPEARERIIRGWNSTRAEFPTHRCLHEFFEDIATRTPEAIAVRHRDRSVSYRLLNRQANLLASHLRALGVEPEKSVGILIERSPAMIVALLGILKAGGAYLPIDTALPPERIAFMLEDSHTEVVMTQRGRAGHLPPFGGRVVCIEDILDTMPADAGSLDANPPAGTEPASLAYIIYTSGSTGRPKAVLIEHRSAVNFTFASIMLYGARRGDRILQFASISFDASCEEIFVSLSVGGTLVLRTEAMIASASAFLAKCHSWGVTVLDLPTAYWHDLVTQLHARPEPWPSTVRLVIIGGERAQPEKLALWQRLVPRSVRLINSYGPTETTVAATGCDLTDLPNVEHLAELPIGRPLANLSAYIVDRRLEPVPVGVPGELLIGGAGLARGYLNRPELTAEKFIPDPFDPTPGARLYRTGDLARYRADGEIEYLGRIDDQIKVRGFRIELGEIESALSSHPDVAQAAVVVHSTPPDHSELLAFLVLRPGASLSPASLRDHLRAVMPVYMIPSGYAAVPALPLNSNGKVDRRALMALDRAELRHSSARVPPRTRTESAIAAIWQSVLGHGDFGVTDSFFDIGGHSLLAMRLVTEIQKNFERPLSLARLTASPTIERIAADVADERPEPFSATRSVLRGSGNGTPLFFTPGLGGFEFLPPVVAEAIAGHHHYFDALQMPGADATRPPLEDVEMIANALVEQINAAHPSGPCAVAGFCYGALVAYEVARQLETAGREVRALIIWHGYPDGTWRRRSVPEAMWTLLRNFLRKPGDARRALVRDKVHFVVDQTRRWLRRRIRRNKFGPAQNEIPGIDFLPPDVDRRVVRANLRASDHFRPKPHHGRTFLIMGATERTFYECPPLAGWDGLLDGQVEMFQIQTEHLDLIKQPHVDLLARQTLACLKAADEDAPAPAVPGVDVFPRSGPR